jgi:hypothetical protein
MNINTINSQLINSCAPSSHIGDSTLTQAQAATELAGLIVFIAQTIENATGDPGSEIQTLLNNLLTKMVNLASTDPEKVQVKKISEALSYLKAGNLVLAKMYAKIVWPKNNSFENFPFPSHLSDIGSVDDDGTYLFSVIWLAQSQHTLRSSSLPACFDNLFTYEPSAAGMPSGATFGWYCGAYLAKLLEPLIPSGTDRDTFFHSPAFKDLLSYSQDQDGDFASSLTDFCAYANFDPAVLANYLQQGTDMWTQEVQSSPAFAYRTQIFG